MLIQEMTERECLEAIDWARFGRLACARDNQPYVPPFYFAYREKYLYSFATLGRKIEWMRSNPLVCVEVDEVISGQDWMSVIVFGRYEEMPDTPLWQGERELAHDMLSARAMWWQPGYVAMTHRGQPHSMTPLYYRIRIDDVTGHRAVSEETKVEKVSPASSRSSFSLKGLRDSLRDLRKRL